MHRFGIFSCCLLFSVLLSGCLTPRNALPPSSGRHTVSPRYGKAAKNTRILTDASSAPRDVRASGSAILNSYAEVLGVKPGELKNPALYQYINNWIGTPHRLGGTTHNGIDCSAFVEMVVQDVYGKSLPRTSADMARDIKRKYEKQLNEGDLVFFSFGRGIDHVGIYLQNHKFVHVSTSRGVIISDLHDSWYYKYFRRAGAVR